jgi:hypothetical protein
MAAQKNYKVFQTCLGSTLKHKFECDLKDSESKPSEKIRQILADYYKKNPPFGWDDYKKQNGL